MKKDNEKGDGKKKVTKEKGDENIKIKRTEKKRKRKKK